MVPEVYMMNAGRPRRHGVDRLGGGRGKGRLVLLADGEHGVQRGAAARAFAAVPASAGSTTSAAAPLSASA